MNDRHSSRLGILLRFVAFLAITATLTVWIGAQIVGVELGDRYTLTAAFDDVSGLREGDVVKLAGVDIGEVTDVAVDLGRAVIDFEVDEDVAVPDDSTVEVRWRNLIGQRYLSIVPGASEQLLADGATVERTENVVDLGQLVNQLAPLARSVSPDQINTILTGLLEAFDGNAGAFDSVLRDLSTVLDTLATRDQTISGMLTDYEAITSAIASRDEQIQAMVSNLVELSGTFAANDQLLDQALVDFAGFTQGIDTFLTRSGDDLGALVDDLAVLGGTVTDNIDELEGALQGLPSVFETLLPVVNQGEWIRVNVVCVTVFTGPCPVPNTFDPFDEGIG
jgi:phospholipid/cholesterol/gamma-HCH transport system substrate-binding protein